jgi:type II secretory pathway component PulM
VADPREASSGPRRDRRSFPEWWRSLQPRTRTALVVGPALVVLVIGVLVPVEIGRRSDYDDLRPADREMVDGLADDGDCAGLQAAFDEAQRTTIVPGSAAAKQVAELMAYADDAMRRIGCYD